MGMGKLMQLLESGDGGKGTGALGQVLDDLLSKNRFKKIRCPKCLWQPSKEDRWMCGADCLHVWNTFDTAGRCPKCGRQWEWTACLACHQWSRHVDWYVS